MRDQVERRKGVGKWRRKANGGGPGLQWDVGVASGGGGTQFGHGRSRVAIDPRIPTMPGRSMPGFHHPGILCLHQARSAMGC